MLALFSIIEVAAGILAAAVGCKDKQANAGFMTKARANQRSMGEQLLEIARAKGMRVPVRTMRGGHRDYSDATFIEREIESHVRAIALYEDEACSSDAQLRAFAQRILPQLHRHLALLQSLKAAH